jgi:hypothetical protein
MRNGHRAEIHVTDFGTLGAPQRYARSKQWWVFKCAKHLDLLALVRGFGELGRDHQHTGVIAGGFIRIACDFREGVFRGFRRLLSFEKAPAG